MSISIKKAALTSLMFLCSSSFSGVKLPEVKVVVQPRFDLSVRSPALDSSVQEWSIRRAQVELAYSDESKLGFGVSADVSKDKILQNAFIRYKPFDFLSIRAGRARPSFGYDMQKAPEKLWLVDNSRTSTFIKSAVGTDRNVGLEISGSLPAKTFYKLGCYDSPNYKNGPFEFVELFAAEAGWKQFDFFQLTAAFRTESFRQHPLLQYRTSFFDVALVSELFQKRWYTEVEFFYGDASLKDYLVDWDDEDEFVTASLRVLSTYRFDFKGNALWPVIAVEHFDNGFTGTQDYTGGIRWGRGEAFFIDLNGKFTVREDSVSGRKITVQGTYIFKRK